MAINTEYYLQHMVTTVDMYNNVRAKWGATDYESPLFTDYTEEMFDLALRAIHYAEIAGFNGEYVCATQASFISLIKSSKEYTNQCKWLEKHYAKRIEDAKAAA